MEAKTETNVGPFYFAGARGQLFGFLHGASGTGTTTRANVDKIGVVMAPGLGHEYVRNHRALRQLAVRLAKAGIAVLRFDYFGIGDSAGELADGNPELWSDDLTRAMGELRRRTAVEKVAVLGFRHGASLAVRVGLQRGGIDELVLWDPVVSGTKAVEDLRRLQADVEAAKTAKWEPSADGTVEVLGFAWPTVLLDGLGFIDLLAVDRAPADAMMVIETSTDTGMTDDFVQRLRDVKASVEARHHPTPVEADEDPFAPFVPSEVLTTITAWLKRERA